MFVDKMKKYCGDLICTDANIDFMGKDDFIVSYNEVVNTNPAKLIKYRFDEDSIKKLILIKWWDWDVEKIKQNIHLLNNDNINKFFGSHL
jgi:hypothetical protein